MTSHKELDRIQAGAIPGKNAHWRGDLTVRCAWTTLGGAIFGGILMESSKKSDDAVLQRESRQ